MCQVIRENPCDRTHMWAVWTALPYAPACQSWSSSGSEPPRCPPQVSVKTTGTCTMSIIRESNYESSLLGYSNSYCTIEVHWTCIPENFTRITAPGCPLQCSLKKCIVWIIRFVLGCHKAILLKHVFKCLPVFYCNNYFCFNFNPIEPAHFFHTKSRLNLWVNQDEDIFKTWEEKPQLACLQMICVIQDVFHTCFTLGPLVDMARNRNAK